MCHHGANLFVILVLKMLLGLTAAIQNDTKDTAPEPYSHPVPLKGYDLFAGSYYQGMEQFNLNRSEENATIVGGDNIWHELLVWSHHPDQDPNVLPNKLDEFQSLTTTLSTIWKWLHWGDAIATLTTNKTVAEIEDANGLPQCLQSVCSFGEACIQRFYCLMKAELNKTLSFESITADTYHDCLVKKFNINENDEKSSTWSCPMWLASDAKDSHDDVITTDQEYSCENEIFKLNQDQWEKSSVDKNLQTALHGGIDSYGVYWEGLRANESLSEATGRQFWDLLGVRCTLSTPCQPVLDCSRIGSYTALALGRLDKPMKLPWVLLASSAFKNLNQQLLNQYNELKDALESLALDTFSIDVFYPPKKDKTLDLQNTLTGLSGIFTILGGFIPFAGQAVEAAGTIASCAGTFLANAAASNDPQEAQKVFSQQVVAYYRRLLKGMEDIVERIFSGERISNTGAGHGSFNITDMMKDGSWVSPNSVSRVSDLNRKLRTEILARAIDTLWKTPTANKVWVLFKDLQDDVDGTKCKEGMFSCARKAQSNRLVRAMNCVVHLNW